MSIVIDGILSTSQALAHVPESLVTVGLHEELGKTQHSLGGWRPLAALLADNTPLLERQRVEAREVVKEGMLESELNGAAA